MRDAKEWYDDVAHAFNCGWGQHDIIRRIQSDASRSERERCAKLMDKDAAQLQGVCNADLARQHAEMIRALPDVGDGEGEAL